MGRETRGNFSDVEEEEEKESGATEIGSDNNRLKSSPDYSEIKIEGEVSKRCKAHQSLLTSVSGSLNSLLLH